MNTDERRARAICAADGRDPDEIVSNLVPSPRGHGMVFGDIVAWKKYLPQARAIRESDRAAGLALVPEEPTNRMVENGGQMLSPGNTLTECYQYFREAWAAAIAAGRQDGE